MSDEPLRQKLFGDKGGKILLGVGLLLIIIGSIAAAFWDVKIGTWLFYLNMRYWSLYMPILLWIIAIWVITESTKIVEDYQPFIRMATAIGVLLVFIFLMQSSGTATDPSVGKTTIWFNVLVVAAVCCAVRSLFLYYHYRYGEEETIDTEEAKWFWGMSGLIITVLLIVGLAYIIPVKVQYSNDPAATETLFKSCQSGLQTALRTGNATVGIRLLGFTLITASVAFIYVAGGWALIFLSRMREE